MHLYQNFTKFLRLLIKSLQFAHIVYGDEIDDVGMQAGSLRIKQAGKLPAFRR